MRLLQQRNDTYQDCKPQTVEISQGCPSIMSPASSWPPKGRRQERGFKLISDHTQDFHPTTREKEMVENQLHNPTATRRRSPYNTRSGWHSSQSIWYQAGSRGSHLRPFVWTLLSGVFCTVLPRTTLWWPWFHGGHRMLQTNPWGNVWVPIQHQCLDKEDIAGITLFLFTYVWRQNCNCNFYHRFPTMLDKGRWTDIILFQRCHLLALQSGSISFNALGNARGVSVCVRTKKDPPCTLGDWAHCATGEDSWQ